MECYPKKGKKDQTKSPARLRFAQMKTTPAPQQSGKRGEAEGGKRSNKSLPPHFFFLCCGAGGFYFPDLTVCLSSLFLASRMIWKGKEKKERHKP
jgi:hypothetical protein